MNDKRIQKATALNKKVTIVKGPFFPSTTSSSSEVFLRKGALKKCSKFTNNTHAEVYKIAT